MRNTAMHVSCFQNCSLKTKQNKKFNLIWNLSRFPWGSPPESFQTSLWNRKANLCLFPTAEVQWGLLSLWILWNPFMLPHASRRYVSLYVSRVPKLKDNGACQVFRKFYSCPVTTLLHQKDSCWSINADTSYVGKYLTPGRKTSWFFIYSFVMTFEMLINIFQTNERWRAF